MLASVVRLIAPGAVGQRCARTSGRSSGQPAIEVAAAQQGDIDILVTDVVLPQILGKEAAERIKALHPDVKILFMYGCTQGVLDTQAIIETSVNLIEKPFTERSLLAELHEILTIRGWLAGPEC